jgi:Short C-terminal domain
MGLIGGIARTAVIAGTATAVSNRVSRRQAARWSQEDQSAAPPPPPQYAQPAPQYAAPPPQYAPPPPQYAAPPPPAAPADDVYAQLRKLAELKDAGILTEEEFTSKKAQLLGL